MISDNKQLHVESRIRRYERYQVTKQKPVLTMTAKCLKLSSKLKILCKFLSQQGFTRQILDVSTAAIVRETSIWRIQSGMKNWFGLRWKCNLTDMRLWRRMVISQALRMSIKLWHSLFMYRHENGKPERKI